MILVVNLQELVGIYHFPIWPVEKLLSSPKCSDWFNPGPVRKKDAKTRSPRNKTFLVHPICSLIFQQRPVSNSSEASDLLPAFPETIHPDNCVLGNSPSFLTTTGDQVKSCSSRSVYGYCLNTRLQVLQAAGVTSVNSSTNTLSLPWLRKEKW